MDIAATVGAGPDHLDRVALVAAAGNLRAVKRREQVADRAGIPAALLVAAHGARSSSLPVHDLWSEEETAEFEAVAAQDRLHPVITLQCLGLRPEEACGLQWRRDIRPRKLEMSVNMARTLVDGKPIEKAPKTAAGCRTLPLDDALAASLTTFHALQAKERLAAGEAYTALDYVRCDETGLPYDPARLRRVWYRLMREAGVRKIKPYTASRHAAGSYLAHAGVSPDIIAAWLGHTDASFTMKTYVHARPEDLAPRATRSPKGRG